jgi:hypothetical protein
MLYLFSSFDGIIINITTDILNESYKIYTVLRLYDTMLNFVENLLENERGPMNDQDLTKTDYDPDRSLVSLIF